MSSNEIWTGYLDGYTWEMCLQYFFSAYSQQHPFTVMLYLYTVQGMCKRRACLCVKAGRKCTKCLPGTRGSGACCNREQLASHFPASSDNPKHTDAGHNFSHFEIKLISAAHFVYFSRRDVRQVSRCMCVSKSCRYRRVGSMVSYLYIWSEYRP